MIEALDATGNRKPPLRLSRGPLTVMSAPWRTYWRGLSIGAIKPMQSKMLYVLMLADGETVPHAEFDLLLNEDTGWNAVAVHFSMLRRAFRTREIPIEIESVRGRGYRLKGPIS